MTAKPTYTEVFDFIGAATDQRTTHQTAVSNLIDRVALEVEGQLGRKIDNTAFTNVLFSDGINCRINGDKLWIHGIYRDIHTITSITEAGQALTAATDYDDDGDYYLDKAIGCLVRVGGYWDTSQLAIKISGSLCIGGGSSGATDLKQALIEMVAAKSGLWKINIETEDGTVNTIKTTVPKSTKEILDRYRLLDIC